MGEAKLNRKLNIVLKTEGVDGTAIYLHSMPISIAVFKEHYLVIGRTFTGIFTNGLGPITGPKIAKYMMLDQAEQLGLKDHIERSFLNEVRRLTNAVIVGKSGWETIPYSEVLKRSLIDEEGVEEAENILVYFMCVSSVRLKTEIDLTLNGLQLLWDAQTTSLNVTEFMNSLRTSTPTENTGGNVTPLPEKPRASIPA
jgi:hypothetical protein